MKKSTWYIVVGAGLLLLPVPPIISGIVGLGVIATGIAMRSSGS